MKSSCRVVAAGVVAVGALMLTRRLTMTWGTADDEHLAPMAGDSVLPGAAVTATRAITIDAAVADVWPWLVQIGYGRGGFYSYDWLENLAGLNIHSADTIVDAWQDLAVGGDVHLAKDFPMRVVDMERHSHLVLHGGGHGLSPCEFTWAFTVSADPRGGTRLVVRERYRPTNWWGRPAIELVQSGSSVMTARMLRGIRDRATVYTGRRAQVDDGRQDPDQSFEVGSVH